MSSDYNHRAPPAIARGAALCAAIDAASAPPDVGSGLASIPALDRHARGAARGGRKRARGGQRKAAKKAAAIAARARAARFIFHREAVVALSELAQGRALTAWDPRTGRNRPPMDVVSAGVASLIAEVREDLGPGAPWSEILAELRAIAAALPGSTLRDGRDEPWFTGDCPVSPPDGSYPAHLVPQGAGTPRPPAATGRAKHLDASADVAIRAAVRPWSPEDAALHRRAGTRYHYLGKAPGDE